MRPSSASSGAITAAAPLNGRPSAQRSLLGRRATARNATVADRLQIVGSRSLLLDVHLLGGPGAGR